MRINADQVGHLTLTIKPDKRHLIEISEGNLCFLERLDLDELTLINGSGETVLKLSQKPKDTERPRTNETMYERVFSDSLKTLARWKFATPPETSNYLPRGGGDT